MDERSWQRLLRPGRVGPLVLLALLLAISCSQTQKEIAPKPAPAVVSPAEYVGVETCKGCHEDRYSSYATSIHAKRKIAGSPATANACESCHGAGADHASKGGGKGVGGLIAFDKKGDARVQSAQCLTCHETSKHTAFWDLGAHKRNVV